MGNFRAARNSFLGGIFGEESYSRTDLESYRTGCKVLENMEPTLSGSARVIAPSVAVPIPDGVFSYGGSDYSRFSVELVTFFKESKYIFSVTDSVLGTTRKLFWCDLLGNFGEVATVVGVNAWNMVNAYTYNPPNYESITTITSGDVAILFSKDAPPHIIVEHIVDVQGTPTTEVSLFPWDAAPLFTASTGLLNASHTWASYPYQDASVSGATVTLNSTKTVITGFASDGVTGLFTEASSKYVGRYLKVNNGANTSVFLVKSKLTASTLSVQWLGGTMAEGITSDDFAMSYYGRNVFPTSGTFFQGRLVLTGGVKLPYMFFSRTGSIFTFMQDRLLQSIDRATDATNGKVYLYGDRGSDWPVVVGLEASDYNSGLNEIVGGVSAVYGTSNTGLHAVFGAGETKVITPTSFGTSKVSSYPCNQITYADNTVFFANAGTGSIYYTQYSNEGGGDQVVEVTALYRPFRSILNLSYCSYMNAIMVHGLQNAGTEYKSIGMIKLHAANSVASWCLLSSTAKADTSNKFDYSGAPSGSPFMFGQITSMDVTPLFFYKYASYTNANCDFVVRVLGTPPFTTVYIKEFLGRQVHLYVQRYSGISPYSTFYEYVTTATMEAGGIDIPADYQEIYGLVVALPNRQTIETLPFISGAEVESADMAIKRIDRVSIRIRNATSQVKVGTVDIFGTEKPDVYSGIVDVSLMSGQMYDATVKLENTGPLAFELNGLVARGVTFD